MHLRIHQLHTQELQRLPGQAAHNLCGAVQPALSLTGLLGQAVVWQGVVLHDVEPSTHGSALVGRGDWKASSLLPCGRGVIQPHRHAD